MRAAVRCPACGGRKGRGCLTTRTGASGSRPTTNSFIVSSGVAEAGVRPVAPDTRSGIRQAGAGAQVEFWLPPPHSAVHGDGDHRRSRKPVRETRHGRSGVHGQIHNPGRNSRPPDAHSRRVHALCHSRPSTDRQTRALASLQTQGPPRALIETFVSGDNSLLLRGTTWPEQERFHARGPRHAESMPRTLAS